MSVNVELKTPAQNNKTWSLSLKANSRIPIVAERNYATLADAQTWVNDLADDATAYAGAIIAVVNDGKNNGIYYVQSIAQAATETTEFVPGVLVAAGAGAGSEAVEDYAAALVEATEDNLGQILYVKTTSYKKGEGYTTVEGEADVDENGNIVAEYTAGPYIVTGAASVAKLGTTSATGDIAGDVESLKGRVGTAEGEIDALQTAVGDAASGLVKGLADANVAIGAVEGRMDTAEGEIDALQTAVGSETSGLIADVAALQELTGEHADTLKDHEDRIGANESAVTELRSAVAGGVHFKGVVEELPFEKVSVPGGYDANMDITPDDPEYSGPVYHYGDILIVAPLSGESAEHVEPSKEYILAYVGEDQAAWVELGDVSPADQKIVALEEDFAQHVETMDAAWEQHLKDYAADKATFALAEDLAKSDKALEDHVAAMAPTIAAAEDYVANKSTFALAANVVAKTDYEARVKSVDDRFDGVDDEIEARKVKDVDTSGVLSLSEAGVVGIDLSNYVTKDGSKVLSDENYSADDKNLVAAVRAGGYANVIESVKVNGTALVVEDKAVNIDVVNALAGKVVVNGTTLVKDEDGVLAANIDASDIHLSADIADYAAAETTVQGMLSAVYDVANSKIGSLHLANNTTTTNVLALSKTNIANDTIELKIAEGSSIKATATGLDLVWTLL